jgi:ABC-type uncharacterized transport system permease subunit
VGLVLLPAALIAYFVGIFACLVGTWTRSRRALGAAAGAYGVAWALHLGAIARVGWLEGRFPLSTLEEYLLVLGWMVLTLHLAVWLRYRVDAAGLILPPLAAGLALAALLLPGSPQAVSESHRQVWFVVHTTLATLGTAALGLSCAMSVIYLLQDRALKAKSRLRALDRLPSLESCDRIGTVALMWGFPVLTLGICMGLVGSWLLHRELWSQGTKEAFSLLAWAVFGGVFVARLARGFRGRRSAWLTIAGFGLALGVVLGMGR